LTEQRADMARRFRARRGGGRLSPGSLGGILGSTLRALFAPLIKKRELAKHIEKTSPKKPGESRRGLHDA
jgi:hypothetical protein